MIAEPYICRKGPKAGQIEWFTGPKEPPGIVVMQSLNEFVPYADFEREKLRELPFGQIEYDPYHGNLLHAMATVRTSKDVIGYSGKDYFADSEANRLLRRAEFLKAVCEKEGVEWLPKPERDFCPKCCYNRNLNGHNYCEEDGCGKQNREGIDVVHVLAEDQPHAPFTSRTIEEIDRLASLRTFPPTPMGNTTVDCPTCGKSHPWPACEGKMKRDDEMEWREAVLELIGLTHWIKKGEDLQTQQRRTREVFEETRSRFLRDKTTP